MGLLSWIKQVVGKMFSRSDVRQVLGIDVAVSADMAAAIDLWSKLFQNDPDWANKRVKPLRLPAAIANEFTRLTMLEAAATINGSPRADWLSAQFQPVFDSLRPDLGYGCALGGMALKPYVSNGKICIDRTPATRFLPTGFDGNGGITGGVFVDKYTADGRYYTRFECHELQEGDTYTIRNVAFASRTAGHVGTEVPLTAVDRWAGLSPRLTLGGITKPLFGYFRVPVANTVDPESPLGVSVYADAVDLIQQADEQWERIQWEFKGSELALDISDRAFFIDPKTGKPIVPEGQERLFRPTTMGDPEKPLYEVFSPTIRDSSLFNGLNNILKRIEFTVGLAYGTLSDPQQVEKTAEEIRTSKQRSYARVAEMQKALQTALTNCVYAMDVWATIAGLAPAGNYDVSIDWDDSIITDPNEEFNRKLQLVTANILRAEEFRAWYTGEDVDTAKANLPGMDALFPDDPMGSGAIPTGAPSAQKAQAAVDDTTGKGLNGAQTQSLLSVIAQYVSKQITLGQAVNIISAAIGVTKEEAKKIIEGTV